MKQSPRSLSSSSTRSSHCNRRARGFTLMEVLLVLAILVILGSLAVNVFSGVQRSANINAAKAQIGLFASGIEKYQFAVGQFPQSLDGLRTLPADVDPGKWTGPYMNKDGPYIDPWDREYVYLPDTGEVRSTGPDGQDSTGDELSSLQ